MTLSHFSQELAEEIETTEHHLHNEQLCFGSDGGSPPSLSDGSLTPFQLTSGTVGVFGTELQIWDGSLGSDEWFDLDQVLVTAAQRTDETYLIEFKAGSGTFAAATRITSFYYRTGSTIAEVVPIRIKSPRVRGDLKIWARVKCTYATASTIDILFHSHLYPGATGDEVDS